MRFLLPIPLLLALSATAALADTYGTAVVDRVTSIYDGDTFRADITGWPAVIGERIPVRLKGANTPELRGECRQEVEQAREAKQFTVEALRSATEIRLEKIERGKYFRLVADVVVDGQNLAEQLIAAGLARPYSGGARDSWCNAEQQD